MKHKALIPAVLLFGIFIGGVIVLQTKGIGATILTEGKKVFFPIAAEPDADPDGDGLKNWEEKIYKTDPRNPDTDGDGYLDGEEVASHYDPTVKAPGDALAGANAAATRPLPKNLTTHLAQILTEKISSGQIDPSKADQVNQNDPTIPYNQEIFNDALAQIAARTKTYFILPEVKDADIKISSSPTTREEIGSYLAAMSSALEIDETLKTLNEHEVLIIKEAIETKDTRKTLLLYTSYQHAVERMKAVSVPRDLAELHKKEIAILMLLEKIMDAVAHFQEDPAKALAGVEVYPQTTDMLQQFSEELLIKISSYQN